MMPQLTIITLSSLKITTLLKFYMNDKDYCSYSIVNSYSDIRVDRFLVKLRFCSIKRINCFKYILKFLTN